MKIHVIGAGFVGQATGRGFLAHDHKVLFIDVDPLKINLLRAAGLSAEMADHVPENEHANISLLTVNTPTRAGKIDLQHIQSAAVALGQRLAHYPDYHLVVVRSTVLPGTSERLAQIIEKHSGKRLGADFGLCMNPEFLREKTATEDFAHPWLIVIGEHDQRSGDMLSQLYQNFGCPIHRVSIREAEMQKYVHNLFNAVKITFFNELRAVAKTAGIDAEAIFPLVAKSAEGMWRPEYGIKDLGPFDGSCLPKDTQAFLTWVAEQGWSAPLLATTIELNKRLEENQALAVKKASQTAPVAQPASAVAG